MVGGAGWRVTYPLGVTETVFKSSKDVRALQIADVLAGAAARWARWRLENVEDTYAEKLDQSFFSGCEGPELLATLLWPSYDVERAEVPDGVENPLDYSARAMNLKRG